LRQQEFHPSDTVRFHARTVNLALDPKVNHDNTSLNLLSGEGDFLLHISFRRSSHRIVFNSRSVTGSWGEEDSIPLSGAFRRTTATVSVTDHGHHFDIFVDGQIIRSFTKRIDLPTKKVSYLAADMNTAAFFGSEVEV
jgi:hypothetical protein